MCGIFGMMGLGVNAEDLEWIKQIAYVSGLRGTDGSGVLQANVSRKNKTYTIAKMGSEISYFTWFHETQKGGNKRIFNNINDNIFMCHVRAATRGEINNQNSHPFDLKTIVGAHNGTLRDKRYDHKTKTDSELFFEDIQERGLEEVLTDLDPDSAYALTIYNKNNGTLTFAKNDKRPLHFTYNTKRRVVYWASERMMLEFILKRIGMDYGIIYKFTDRRIYTVDPLDIEVGTMPHWKYLKDLPKPVEPEPEVKIPLITYQTPERENLTNVLLNETKPPLNLNLRNRNKGKKKLLEHCVYCQCDMDPLSQYEGTQLDEGMWVCKTCEEVNKEVAKEVNKEMMKEHLDRFSPIKGIMH